LNFIEQLAQTIHKLYEENQQLKDEINRLKGENGKPKISSNMPSRETNDPTKKPQNWRKSSKKLRIKIERFETGNNIVHTRALTPKASMHKYSNDWCALLFTNRK